MESETLKNSGYSQKLQDQHDSKQNLKHWLTKIWKKIEKWDKKNEKAKNFVK